MTIVHLIDSLHPGGAERMAVHYANALQEQGLRVHLWVSREEGALREELHEAVRYQFLNRKGKVGWKALWHAQRAIKRHKIQIIHAHGTSYFFGTLLKLLRPSIKLIWHDHYGNRYRTTATQNRYLVFCSRFFRATIAVNKELLKWHSQHLKCINRYYVPNFIFGNAHASLELSTAPAILCLANLRNPKDHGNLIEAFAQIHFTHPNWQLLLVGKDHNDTYAQSLKNKIVKHQLTNAVILLGEQPITVSLFQKASIGVLSSSMEGLPLALLEYGMAGLAVVATDVGYCKEVVKDFGKIVPPKDPHALAMALNEYIQDTALRSRDAQQFHNHILSAYTQEAVLPEVLKLYRGAISCKLEVKS